MRILETDGPKVWTELWQLMESQWQSPDAEFGDFPKVPENIAWVETTQAMWDNQLNVLPPKATGPNCFLVGEPWYNTNDGQDIWPAFRKYGGKVYAAYLTLKMFREL